MKKSGEHKKISRPPVVVVMGHIDHGKSTLLDHIRKTNIVDGEAGGITQHLSAYEVVQKDAEGNDKKITFLDTPGHEAFRGMRERGAQAADVAVLIVSAEDSVKTQTLEAWKTITEFGLPYVVAINKIDRPNANPEKVKMDLAEKGIYLEGFGGDIPFAEISAKAGTGIPHLLELILLVSELAELTGDPEALPEGVVIESHLDPRRGISATLIIKNGTLKSGMYVVAEGAIATTRIMEDFLLRPIKEAEISSPVGIVGWSTIPEVGSIFTSYLKKSEAEEEAKKGKKQIMNTLEKDDGSQKKIPIIIRTDTAGTSDAVVQEIKKLEVESIGWKILSSDVGTIGENDIKMAGINGDTIIIGFNTKIDPRARDLADQMKIEVHFFDIIYKLSEFLQALLEERRPRTEKNVESGVLNVQKFFSSTKARQVVGGTVESGELKVGDTVLIVRRENELAEGKIVGIERNREKVKSVNTGDQCGILVESRTEIAAGDRLKAITKVME